MTNLIKKTEKTENQKKKLAKNIGELKQSGWESLSIKAEIRKNLISKIKSGQKLFPDIYGYEDSIEVQLVNALLSEHNIILLGLRGQGKTKLIRLLVNFLDEYLPVLEGTELNEDPFNPISPMGKKLVETESDKAKIRWIHRSDRYNEKLATPDVSIADLIGDIDPIKAAREKLNISDSNVIHWGIVPRSNRGIFSINELPDLQPRIQVSLFNILEEKDIQIRGFPLRLPLDVLLVFTANPEDYTNRGRIVTPLKDRINSQIITHYPKDLQVAKQISLTQINPTLLDGLDYPEDFFNIIEQISFTSRKSDFVDKYSGVSQRLSIAAMENSLANAQRRKLVMSGEGKAPVRMSDIYAAVPAITGKVELIEERGEEELIKLATTLISQSIKEIFNQIFPKVENVKSSGSEELEEIEEVGVEYQSIVNFFKKGGEIKFAEQLSQKELVNELDRVSGLKKLAEKYAPDKNHLAFYQSMILEGLSAHGVIHRKVSGGYLIFNDLYSSMFQQF